MAFVYAYSTTDEDVVIKDFIADSGFTGAKRGDVVILNASGKVANAGNNPTSVLGVYEGSEFSGLVASGQPYAATSVTNNELSTNTYAKVRISATAVYRVPLKSGATAPVIGTAYGCTSATAPAGSAAVIDTANTATGAIFKVVDFDSNTNNCFVIIVGSARQIA